MKVLFITRKYPPVVGGMEMFAYDLSRALSGQTKLRLVKWSGSGRLKHVLIGLPYLLASAFLVLVRDKVDVIHVQDGVLAPLGYVLSKLFRKPYVVVIHGLDVTYTNRLFKAVVPAAVRRAGAVICISQAAAARVINLGTLPDKVFVVPLAVDDKLYGKSSRDKLIKALNLKADNQILLSVGRLVERKGVAWFVDHVLPELMVRYPKLVFVVIGEGEEKNNIEAAARRHTLDKRVLLLGKVSQDLLNAAYNGSDVFVMPNVVVSDDMEGFGLVVLEASMCQLPVVASDLEGIKDAVINGKNGILVPSGSISGFIENIDQFLSDKKYAVAFGKKSRKFSLTNYRWNQVAEKYIEIYKRLRQA